MGFGFLDEEVMPVFAVSVDRAHDKRVFGSIPSGKAEVSGFEMGVLEVEGEEAGSVMGFEEVGGEVVEADFATFRFAGHDLGVSLCRRMDL